MRLRGITRWGPGMYFGRARTRLLIMSLGFFLVGEPMLAAADQGFTLATGRPSGKSFAVGVGISALAKVKLLPSHNMDLSAVESQGFVQNVRMLQKDEAQFAILQAMFGHFVRTGTGTFAGEPPDDSIRAIAMLWRDADHFVIDKAYQRTGTIADLEQLRGVPVSMGLDGPGPIESNRLLLSHFEIDVDHAFNLSHLNYTESARALRNGQIKAMSTPTRPPAPHVTNVLANSGGRHTLLSFTDDQITKADGGLGIWTPYVIPAATYPGQRRDVQTVAKSNLLVARADVDDEVVYQVTKSMFANLKFLRSIHDALYETSLDRAMIGVPMPLHPGALRYYKEMGLIKPDAGLGVTLADEVRLADNAAYEPNGALKATLQTTARSTTLDLQPQTVAAGGDKTFVVYFGLNEKMVNGEGVQALAEASAYADNLMTAEIIVSGHTDRSGDPAYNTQLAESRARAVTEILTHQFADRRHTVKLETHAADAPALDDGRQYQPENRRVEITVRHTVVDPGLPQQAVVPTSIGEEPIWTRRVSI